MKLIRKILFPFVPIYYGITWMRNFCYDTGFFKSSSYNSPIICVGNLSVGGTGKTPMIEYLIRLLKDNYQLATLSRGYKRSTKGFKLANETSSVESIGDEPFQFYTKFKNVIVSVDEDRRNGISELKKHNNPDVVLLDDAYQHRKVKAGLNVLLTSYGRPYIDDITLPTGDLREPKSGARRANIIVVTKCPKDISLQERNMIKSRLEPALNQDVFFSTIDYSRVLYSKQDDMLLSKLKNTDFTLVTGIADATPLVDFLINEGFKFKHLNYKDHHVFSDAEIKVLEQEKLIVTTEKDFTRLGDKVLGGILYYLPIESKIFEQEKFNKLVLNFCTSY